MTELTAGLVLSIFGRFAWDTIKGAVKGAWGNVAEKRLQDTIEAAVRRFTCDGSSGPPIDLALRRALGSATRAIAYHLHDPKRGPMSVLLEDVSDWPTFFLRFAELAQNNIVAGTPRDHWLAQLIDESKELTNFADFRFNLAIDDNEISRILRGETDNELREHVHRELLAWVERHVPDNGHKPETFASVVRRGWTTGSETVKPLAFYDIFCQFFRETVTAEIQVFRAFSVDLLTRLQLDIAEVKRGLPDAETLRHFEEVMRTFEEKEFDANYSRFKVWTRRQNEKLFQFLRTEFSAVHQHLQLQGEALESTRNELTGAREDIREAGTKLHSLRRFLGLAAVVIVVLLATFIVFLNRQTRATRDLEQKLASVTRRDASDSNLLDEFRKRYEAAAFSIKESDPGMRTDSVLAGLAREYGLTVDELQQKLLKGAESAHERLALVQQLRLASERKAARYRELERNSMTELAISALAASNYGEALENLSRAIRLTDQTNELNHWAGLQLLTGIVYHELGLRSEGSAVVRYLNSSVSAYRQALMVLSRNQHAANWAAINANLGSALSDIAHLGGANAMRYSKEAISAYGEAMASFRKEGLAQAFAAVQSNLGAALYEQATWTGGPGAGRLMTEAVDVIRAALTVIARETSPQVWAGAQNNLGIALGALALRSEGPDAARLLGEAITAYRNSLKVFDRQQSPRGWAGAQSNLGTALRERALRSEGPEVARLLTEAIGEFGKALSVFNRERYPQEWALVHNELGLTMREQAGRTEGPQAVQLLSKAVSAHRAAQEVYRREHLPEAWAATLHNLGVALHDQSLRTEAPYAVRLLMEAISAFDSALAVRTREAMPWDWAMTQNSLGIVLRDLSNRTEGPEAIRFSAEAIGKFNNSLTVYTREQRPQDWAMTQANLGTALLERSKLIRGGEGATLSTGAVTAFTNALTVYTREQFPQGWATAQNNLGNALMTLASAVEGNDEASRFFKEAIDAFRKALLVRTRNNLPQAWATSQNNLGAALVGLARRSEHDAEGLLSEATNVLHEALAVRDRDWFPQNWASLHYNLGKAFTLQWGLRENSDPRLLERANHAFREALQIYKREQFPNDWAMAQSDLGETLAKQAFRAQGEEAVRLSKESIRALREALSVFTPEMSPRDWAGAQNNLGLTLSSQAQWVERSEAIRLLGEAVNAYQAALTVFANGYASFRLEMLTRNLAQAETQLTKLRDAK